VCNLKLISKNIKGTILYTSLYKSGVVVGVSYNWNHFFYLYLVSSILIKTPIFFLEPSHLFINTVSDPETSANQSLKAEISDSIWWKHNIC